MIVFLLTPINLNLESQPKPMVIGFNPSSKTPNLPSSKNPNKEASSTLVRLQTDKP